eukprot:582930-Heterocapsa_arctica.AAC.1
MSCAALMRCLSCMTVLELERRNQAKLSPEMAFMMCTLHSLSSAAMCAPRYSVNVVPPGVVPTGWGILAEAIAGWT